MVNCSKNLIALAEGVGAKYVHRSRGYHVSPTQAKLFEFLVHRGFRAGTLIFNGQKPKFWDKDNKEFNLKKSSLFVKSDV